MKTLIVRYTPRGNRSQSKILLDHFTNELGTNSVEVLDLLKNNPDYFLEKNLSSYIKRHYLSERLSQDEQESLEKMDLMTEQILRNDVVVLVTPMHNFSLPGIVKSWFDSVLQKGRTWDIGANGYTGLMNKKNALILMASGGIYDEDMASWDHASSLGKQLFNFMGFKEVHCISTSGVNADPERLDKVISNNKRTITDLVRRWYIKT